jgi:hypothetical protein
MVITGFTLTIHCPVRAVLCKQCCSARQLQTRLWHGPSFYGITILRFDAGLIIEELIFFAPFIRREDGLCGLPSVVFPNSTIAGDRKPVWREAEMPNAFVRDGGEESFGSRRVQPATNKK